MIQYILEKIGSVIEQEFDSDFFSSRHSNSFMGQLFGRGYFILGCYTLC